MRQGGWTILRAGTVITQPRPTVGAALHGVTDTTAAILLDWDWNLRDEVTTAAEDLGRFRRPAPQRLPMGRSPRPAGSSRHYPQSAAAVASAARHAAPRAGR